jgi:hypothetical protein
VSSGTIALGGVLAHLVDRRRFPAPLRSDVELVLGEPIRFDADTDHATATTQLEAAVAAP